MIDQRLSGLVEQLRRSREDANQTDVDGYPNRLAQAHLQLDNVPLLHGTGLQHLEGIWKTRALRSSRALGRPEQPHQRCFGTYGAIYASVGVMYPARQAAFAFSANVELTDGLNVDATPWDTGCFYSHIAHKLGLLTDQECAGVYRERLIPLLPVRSTSCR